MSGKHTGGRTAPHILYENGGRVRANLQTGAVVAGLGRGDDHAVEKAGAEVSVTDAQAETSAGAHAAVPARGWPAPARA